MMLRGDGLDKKDFFGKSDPFLVFHKVNEDGLYVELSLLIVVNM